MGGKWAPELKGRKRPRCVCPNCGDEVNVLLDRTLERHPKGGRFGRGQWHCPASRNPVEHDEECAACSDRHPKWRSGHSHLGQRWAGMP